MLLPRHRRMFIPSNLSLVCLSLLVWCCFSLYLSSLAVDQTQGFVDARVAHD